MFGLQELFRLEQTANRILIQSVFWYFGPLQIQNENVKILH